MLIIPAIDLKDGACVRLRQGRMEDSTVFSDDPVSMAAKWVEGGCRRLHLVDLNGAFEGQPVNGEVVTAIAIDGADRKWFGTANGVWLFSADGTQQTTTFLSPWQGPQPVPEAPSLSALGSSRMRIAFFEPDAEQAGGAQPGPQHHAVGSRRAAGHAER